MLHSWLLLFLALNTKNFVIIPNYWSCPNSPEPKAPQWVPIVHHRHENVFFFGFNKNFIAGQKLENSDINWITKIYWKTSLDNWHYPSVCIVTSRVRLAAVLNALLSFRRCATRTFCCKLRPRRRSTFLVTRNPPAGDPATLPTLDIMGIFGNDSTLFLFSCLDTNGTIRTLSVHQTTT